MINTQIRKNRIHETRINGTIDDLVKLFQQGNNCEIITCSPIIIPNSGRETKIDETSLLLHAVYACNPEYTRRKLGNLRQIVSSGNSRAESKDYIAVLSELSLKSMAMGTIAREYLSTNHNRPSALERCTAILTFESIVQETIENNQRDLFKEYEANIELLKYNKDLNVLKNIRSRTDKLALCMTELLSMWYVDSKQQTKIAEIKHQTEKYFNNRRNHDVISRQLEIAESSRNSGDSGNQSYKLVRPRRIFRKPGILYQRCVETEYYEGIVRCNQIYNSREKEVTKFTNQMSVRTLSSRLASQ